MILPYALHDLNGHVNIHNLAALPLTSNMSLSVKHLNADTTFLLTFSSSEAAQAPAGHLTRPGTFSILIDPWLSGDSTVFHPKFAFAKHTIPACVDHLSEIAPPNVVLISQDKPDHCHEATLRQLDPLLRHTVILATSAAAKKIRGWKYFNPARVHTLPTFSEKNASSIIRFTIPSPLPGAESGEVTIANIPQRDLTGLHNALGITYRAPSLVSPFTPLSSPTASDDPWMPPPMPNLALQRSPYMQTFPPTPPDSPDGNSYFSASSPLPDSFFRTSTTSSISSAPSIYPIEGPKTPLDVSFCPPTTMRPSTSYAPLSPVSTFTSAFRPTTSHSLCRQKTMSVIYSPHGVTYSHIHPYATSHLVSNAALPLTLLLHPFDHIQNPWYLGGNISAGAPGGLDILQKLMGKCWISAHDEEKDKGGFSVMKIVTRKHTAEEVRALAAKDRKSNKVPLNIRTLDCGDEITLRA